MASQLTATPPPRDVSGIQQAIFSVANCLEEKINILKSLSTTDAEAQTHIVAIEAKIAEETANIQISTDRLTHMKNPAASASFYQSWFPLDRPMKQFSYHVLIGLAVSISFVAFGYLVGLANVYFIVTRVSNDSLIRRLGLEWLVAIVMTQFTVSFWIALAVAIGLIIYVTKK